MSQINVSRRRKRDKEVKQLLLNTAIIVGTILVSIGLVLVSFNCYVLAVTS